MARFSTQPAAAQELTYRQGRDCLLRLRPLVRGPCGCLRWCWDASAVQVRLGGSGRAASLPAPAGEAARFIVEGLPRALQSMAALHAAWTALMPALVPMRSPPLSRAGLTNHCVAQAPPG